MLLDFFKKHNEIFTFLGLGIIFYIIFFYGTGSYPLMDIDETRYASMAHDMFKSKDFMTLYLNGEYFFEKPPLFFWLECLSFSVFGKVNEFTGKIPLEVHHIDGDCTNNKEENLQLLCPNCHSLTENFGSRNKNSKRYKLKAYKKFLQL